MELVTGLASLRRKDPDARDMILGIDSVGMDSDWRPEWQAPARTVAAGCNMHVAIHFAESWHDGGLIRTLERLELLVNNGVLDQLDNANALFARNDAEY